MKWLNDWIRSYFRSTSLEKIVRIIRNFIFVVVVVLWRGSGLPRPQPSQPTEYAECCSANKFKWHWKKIMKWHQSIAFLAQKITENTNSIFQFLHSRIFGWCEFDMSVIQKIISSFYFREYCFSPFILHTALTHTCPTLNQKQHVEHEKKLRKFRFFVLRWW